MNHHAKPYPCPDCGDQKTGNFCSNCGQHEDERYNLHLLIHEVIHAVTHADKGIFSYSIGLLYKPGIIASDFVEGKRKRYFNPFQYLIIILGLYILTMSATHFMEKMTYYMNQNQKSYVKTELDSAFAIFNKYQKFIYLALVPLTTFVIQLLFRKKGFNYTEHLVGYVVYFGNSLFVHSLIILLSFLPIPFTPLMTLSSIIPIFYMALYFRQFYKVGWIEAILKSVGY
ncbi:MAG: DUF3667 domain-containing protein, partial [Flavitalea sp.]